MQLYLSTTSGASGTYGSLVAGRLTLMTIELPWLNNAANKSCVPAGMYALLPYDSPDHGPTWRLDNPDCQVSGTDPAQTDCRSEIEIHTGNFVSQSKGCILVGLSNGTLANPATGKTESAVLDSIAALQQLREALVPNWGHTLWIYRGGLYQSE